MHELGQANIGRISGQETFDGRNQYAVFLFLATDLIGNLSIY